MEIKKSIIRVAWIHNFNRDNNPSSGVFMYQLYDSLYRSDSNLKIDLINIGGISNPLLFPFKLLKYHKILKEYNVLHAQYGSGTGFFTSLFSNKKILSLRGSDWYYFPSNNVLERFHSWLSCKLTRWCIKRFDSIIVMSERMKVELKSEFSTLSVQVIPDGINLSKFYPVRNKAKSFRVLFSSINRNNRLKRFDLAEKAFAIFREKHPDSELVFMNDVSHDKVNELINSVDVILLTSTHEGWPNIIKEGLACNVPFVSTEVSDLRTIAEKTGSCFVCEDNPESLANGLTKATLREGEKNIRYLAQQFDILEISKRLIELYKNSFNC